MALRKTGVLFKVKNPGKLVMTGKLQVTREMIESWRTYPQESYKDKTYVNVEIGVFKNDKDGNEYYPILEFLPDGQEGDQQQGEEKTEDSGLPF